MSILSRVKNGAIVIGILAFFAACQSFPLIGDRKWSRMVESGIQQNKLTCIATSTVAEMFNPITWFASPPTYYLSVKAADVSQIPGYSNAFAVEHRYASRRKDSGGSSSNEYGATLYYYDVGKSKVAYIGPTDDKDLSAKDRQEFLSNMRNPDWKKPMYTQKNVLAWLKLGAPSQYDKCKSW